MISKALHIEESHTLIIFLLKILFKPFDCKMTRAATCHNFIRNSKLKQAFR